VAAAGFTTVTAHTLQGIGEESLDAWASAEITGTDRWAAQAPRPTWLWCIEEELEWVGYTPWIGSVGGFGPRREMIFLFSNAFSIQHRSPIILGKILRDLKNYGNFPGGRLEYLEQLLCWEL
jgi:hypothetical protein